MTRMVADRALALLSQSVSDIVGHDNRVAHSILRVAQTGSQLDFAVARSIFDRLDPRTRQVIQGRALDLASQTIH